jgi:hypothetical protein
MIYQIEYLVPVWVHVNTDTKRVTRVVVADESIDTSKPRKVLDLDGTRITGNKAVRLIEDCQEIVDESEWPAWEFGL